MDKEKYNKSIIKLLDDEIIKIRENYKILETLEFNGPGIILMLANKELEDEDLLIDFYNETDGYHMISTKKEALKYIKNGKLKYINMAYSTKYINSKIVNDIKNYILNYNTFSKKFCDEIWNGFDLNSHIKYMMILNLEKCFENIKDDLIDYINECLEESMDYDEEDIDIDYYDNLQLDKENIYSVYEFINNDEIINELLDIETIKEAKECFDPEKYNNYTELDEYIEDDEYLTFLIKKYYESKFNSKETIYIEGIDDKSFKYDKTIDYRYRKLLTDLYNKINAKFNKEDTIYTIIDILNNTIIINSSYYDSYINDIDDYKKILNNLKLVIISDYYKYSINNKLLDIDDKSYIAYISDNNVSTSKIIELFDYEEDFSKKAILGFLNYNPIKEKDSIDKKYTKIIEKINPFKRY